MVTWQRAVCMVLALAACHGGGEQSSPTSTTHHVSGSVSPAGAGAAVALGTKIATADAGGAYSFADVADGTYTVTPTKTGITFTPASRSVTVKGADVTGVDFAVQGGGGTVTLSGTVHAAAGQLVDSDTADVNAPHTANDTPATAQAVPSAVTVGGHASLDTDKVDAYRGSFAAGEVARLDIADPDQGDLDLYLYAAADTDTPIATSMGNGASESVTIPAGGDYYVVVAAASGASNYVLTIGTNPAAGGARALRLEAEFVPGEVIVQLDDAVTRPAGARADDLPARAAALGLVALAGAAHGRPALLGLGRTAGARAAALSALGVVPDAAGPFGAPRDAVVAAKRDTLLAVKALRARADVRSADPNFIAHPTAVPDDKLWGYQWDFPMINLPQAWDVTTGLPPATGVIVAVIDTGVFLDHPDLAGQLIAGYDFISDPSMSRDGDGIDANPDDPGDSATAGSSSWHGTHVTGTIAARANDGAGVAGVAWGAKVMPVRVLGVGGGTTYDIIQGVRFAAGLSNDSGTVPPMAADIANLSLGCQDCFAQAAQDAYSAARAAGMIIVAAAGNQSTSEPGYPASYDGVVSVAAVTMAGAQAHYSNSGPTIDVAAPGGDNSVDSDGNGFVDGVLSTLVDDANGTREAVWVFYDGTSMASPHVAGVIALMKSVCPTLTPAQVDTLLAGGQMTTDVGAPGRDDIFGYGLIDAFASVRAAQTQCGTMPATAVDMTPARLDFGSATTTATLTAAKQGTGDLTVTGATADAAWLTIAPAAVDAGGLGTYTVSVSRAGLSAGPYAGRITVAVAGGASVSIPVSMQVGTTQSVGDDGYVYVLLLDSSQNAVGQVGGRSANGALAFQFTDVAPGSYFLVAGTDSDNDDLVCDAGEVCGAWPTMNAPTAVTVGTASQTGLDFVAGFSVSFGTTSAVAPPRPRGYRRPADTKAFTPPGR
jgi:serine protease